MFIRFSCPRFERKKFPSRARLWAFLLPAVWKWFTKIDFYYLRRPKLLSFFFARRLDFFKCLFWGFSEKKIIANKVLEFFSATRTDLVSRSSGIRTFILATRCIESQIQMWGWSAWIWKGSGGRRADFGEWRPQQHIPKRNNFTSNCGMCDVHLCNCCDSLAAVVSHRIELDCMVRCQEF